MSRSRLYVVANARWHSLNDAVTNVLPILRVILGLLPVYQSHSIYIVVLVVGVLVPSHNEVLLGLLESYGAHWLGSFAGNVHVRHVLV